MTTHEITAIADRLELFNSWRRGEEIPQPDSEQIGADIDDAVALLRKLAELIGTASGLGEK